MGKVIDPFQFAAQFWPDVRFYRQQEEIIRSVAENDETFVPAANMLGKDFVAGFIALWFFMSRRPCRIVTSSAKEDHLRVLWGEIGRFIQTARIPLDASRGGPLIVHHRQIRMVLDGQEDKFSYLIGMVAAEDRVAAMQGHHVAHTGDGIPRTLFVADEASSMPDSYYKMCRTWAKRILVIGNAWPCENFFKHAIKGRPGTEDHGGDIPVEDESRYYRKVIRIKAEDSPNVQFAQWQEKTGREVTDEVLIPGVLPYSEYKKRRKLWDNVQQCVGLDAEFYEGAEVMMFPPEWLNRAETVAETLERTGWNVRTLGVDPAEGGDKTAWVVADERGVIDLVSFHTPDTSVITSRTLAMMREYHVDAGNVVFDAGGGGRAHADRLRQQGYKVRAVGFGESASNPNRFNRHIMRIRNERRDDAEMRYVYRNRRAEMYGILRERLDPVFNPLGFGIPARFAELRRQLGVIPLQYDGEGRLELPPKTKRDRDSNKVTMVDLIGHSPDEADALVLAVYGLARRPTRLVAGAL